MSDPIKNPNLPAQGYAHSEVAGASQAKDSDKKFNNMGVSLSEGTQDLNIPEEHTQTSEPLSPISERKLGKTITTVTIPDQISVEASKAGPIIKALRERFPDDKKAHYAALHCTIEWNTMKVKNDINSLAQMFMMGEMCGLCDNPWVGEVPDLPEPSKDELKEQGITLKEWTKQISDKNLFAQQPFLEELIKLGVLFETDSPEGKEQYHYVGHIKFIPEELEKIQAEREIVKAKQS